MKRGLVLEGGGLRGMFTAGVLDAMLEEGVAVDGVIGVSAGALFGCNFVSQQQGRALRYNVRLKDDKRYMGWRTLLRTGNIVSAHFAYHVVPFEIDVFDAKTFRESSTEFWLTCTDIRSGQPLYRRMDDFTHEELEWMRASASMPALSRPVKIDGLSLLDGGLSDSIPLKAFQSMGYERNIVILTQPKGYWKKPWRCSWMFRMLCPCYPEVARLMARRHEMYNGQLRYLMEQERLGNVLVIAPEERLPIGRTQLDEAKMRSVHALGVKTARGWMDEIIDFLK